MMWSECNNSVPLAVRLGWNIGPYEPSGCRLWSGGRDAAGYGMISVAGRSERVTRVLLGLKRGAPLYACHHCDNPSCVHMAHLYIGTLSDNAQDRVARGRDFLRKRTHCFYGHAYEPANVRLTANGARRCVTCSRLKSQLKRDRRKQRASRVELVKQVTLPRVPVATPRQNEWLAEPIAQPTAPAHGDSCPRGHPLSDENLAFDRGSRKCRECARTANRRYRRSL